MKGILEEMHYVDNRQYAAQSERNGYQKELVQGLKVDPYQVYLWIPFLVIDRYG